MRRPKHLFKCMGLLLIGLILPPLCVACSPSPHQTYHYDLSDVPPTASWHPGRQPVVHWKAQPDSMTTDAAAQIELSVELIGPLTSESALHHHPPATGPLAVSSTPILTDSWSGKDFTSVLDLPATLQTGTYDLRLSVKEQSANHTSTRTRSIIVFVTPSYLPVPSLLLVEGSAAVEWTLG